MKNLSELSIQLRKLQYEKNAQANEIDRLERQLRIVSELKGVSISDLHNALSVACEGEAHAELQSIVGKLQARVDGLELGGSGVGGRRFFQGGREDDDDNRIPTQEQFDQEAAARARTTLQLRVGELEELESTLRSEMDSLYRNSQGLTERNTFLETTILQQQAQLEQWERRWKAKEEEDKTRTSIVPMVMPSTATGSYNYSEFTTTNNASSELQPTLLHYVPQSQIDTEREQRLLAAETALAGEKQQRSLVQRQLSSAQKSYDLKIDQYQHRIQFLEEQINELEQQMSSLYAAFGIMQTDSKAERSEKEAWKKTLLESDAAKAKEETERERNQQFTPKASSADKRPGAKMSSITTLTNRLSPPPSLPKAAVKPAAHPPIAKGHLFLLLDKDGQSMPPNASPTTRRKSFSALKKMKSPSSRKQSAMKKQYCVLHGANGLYQIRYGDTYTGAVSGVHEFITAGVSSIDHTSRSSSQPFGFEIFINANHAEAPILCCAAESEEDFLIWMSALTSVIDGTLDNRHSTAAQS
mmetsp:Transcript_5474/g.13722  ORF Transcript_5474/g.13722 Transcript_5474/m.13722 type:complete len:528 (-) Transcript_5474:373-1956(-)